MKEKPLYYKIKDKIPIAVTDVLDAELGNRPFVGRDHIGEILISTAFLGIDHQWGKGPPLLFETMIFGGEHDEYQERYATWEEAEEGHKRAVTMVRGVRE